MIRKIIHIDEEKCNGCGACVTACHEGAIGLVNGKAKLMRDDYCCPGHQMHQFDRKPAPAPAAGTAMPSQLGQWPCQIKLVPVNAPYFNGAKLLIAADCTAYAYANIHQEFMQGRITLIGCPKLDAVEYSEKLTAILSQNDIRSVTVLRMEVPCCGGLEHAAVTALKNSGKFIPWQVVTFSIDGRILDR